MEKKIEEIFRLLVLNTQDEYGYHSCRILEIIEQNKISPERVKFLKSIGLNPKDRIKVGRNYGIQFKNIAVTVGDEIIEEKYTLGEDAQLYTKHTIVSIDPELPKIHTEIQSLKKQLTEKKLDFKNKLKQRYKSIQNK